MSIFKCVVTAAAGILLAGDLALACPVCHTGTGEAVRAGIFGNGDFLENFLSAIAPFPILAGAVAAFHYMPSIFEKEHDDANEL